MAKLIKEKLLSSLGYSIISILVVAFISLILVGFSYLGIGRFTIAKIPMYIYLVTSFVMSSLFFLLTSSKDYYQDLPIMVESSYHRKEIKKAMMVERIFNIILATAIILLGVFVSKFIGNILQASGIRIYYTEIYKNTLIINYIPHSLMITALASLILSGLMYLAYRFNSILVFLAFIGGLLFLNYLYFQQIKNNVARIFTIDQLTSLIIGIISIIIGLLLTNLINKIRIRG